MRRRLVVPATAVEQIEALPLPDVEELGEWETVPLGGEEVEVLDLVTRKRWHVRRAQCGLGLCACDLQAWPVDYAGPIPESEVADGGPFWLDEDGWDALEAEVGKPVGDYAYPDLLAAVEEARGAGA